MLEMMRDSAHDSLHIYRVLHQSLKIATAYEEVNRDVLVASCLLHAIGRDFPFCNPQVRHAIEAKILFDSDKLDVSGAMGIACSLIYGGQVGKPLYTVDENNRVQDGESLPESFVKEYHFRLMKVYDGLYTKEARAIAQKRKKFTACFYDELMAEITICGQDKWLCPYE